MKNFRLTLKSMFLVMLVAMLTIVLVACGGKKVESIEVSATDVTVMMGKSVTVEARVKPENATDVKLTWETENDRIATVVNGTITGVAVGKTKVTVTAGKISKVINVEVIEAKIKVTFNTDGGTIFPEQLIEVGGKASYPGTPKKEGYKFDGWYKKDLTTEFDFEESLNEDTEVFAKWTANKYRVVFKSEGMTHHEAQVEHGQKVTKPADPEKQGYNFDTWFKGDVAFDFNTPITEAIELAAHFTPKTDTPYVVRHYKYNPTTQEFDLIDTENLTGTTDAKVTAVPKEISGYMTEKDVYEGIVAADGSLVIDVKYVLLSFSIEYKLNGGNFTYESRAQMVEEFLSDYNTAMGHNYTLADIESHGNWSPIDFPNFFYVEEYREKWLWMADYLSQVGSSTNKPAAKAILDYNDFDSFNKKNDNYKYAFTYEVRAFILGIKYTKNANWMSSDYSDFDLANGFWDTFVKYREVTKFTDLTEEVDLIETAYKEGYNFAGWYTTPDFQGEPVTKIRGTRLVTLYAKWTIKNPVTEIQITNPIAVMEKHTTHQLAIKILPENAFNKLVVYETSDDKLLQVSETGLIKAINAGTATITVKSVATGVSATVTITVNPQDDITVAYTDGFDGTLQVNKEVKLTLAGVGKLKDSAFTFKSNDTNILTVDANGNVKGVATGVGTIDIALAANNQVILTVTITVIPEPTTDRIDKLLALLIAGNNPVVDTVNASLYYDNYSAFQQYYDSKYGTVNLFLFDELNLNDKDYLINPATQTNKHSGIKSSTEFIVIHDTANISGGLTNHGNYWKQDSHSTSIHFTVGDGGVIQSLDTKYAAHHAGDGTSTKFSWTDTGIPSNGNKNPKISINEAGNFTFNGIDSKVAAPRGNNGQILDESYFTNLGPTWTIGANGNYMIGKHVFDTSQTARGVIGSRGGNLNSIGIEMCVNTNGDIIDTWHRTAKLVAKLLQDNNLDISRVVQHNTFTGKNCPQSLIMSNYWNKFMQMVELEYIIRTQYSDAKISMVSNNPTLVNNKGLVIGEPKLTTSVTYTITVEIGGVSKSITLGSVIPGTSSWSQLDGMYSTKK